MKTRIFLTLCGLTVLAVASSHREAPHITKQPKLDGTDFYMFRSYEPGREDYVTLIACYQPLQEPGGGPNYFTMDPKALYEIHIDNNGDGLEDVTFQFRFTNTRKDLTLNIGGTDVAVPVLNLGGITAGDSSLLNVDESYTLTMVTGDRRTGQATPLGTFPKPVDNIGNKSIEDYATYANTFVRTFNIPGCENPGRVFAGQRKDPFVVNLGEAFDLFNLNPVGPEDGNRDTLADKNITAICLEVPIACLTNGTEAVIGGWTTASARQARLLNPAPGQTTGATVEGGAFVQQSRLGMALVNELVIGLKDKDRFNASEPKDDGQFATYVTNPTVPAILQILFGVSAPQLFPRTDLVQVFLTGVPGLNEPTGVTPAEMLRLNTTTTPVAKGAQNKLGVIAGDVSGFPNGRRPGDDVVDIVLRVAMGVLLPAQDAPDGQLPYTDGAIVDDSFFDAAFPYLRTPLRGAPDEE